MYEGEPQVPHRAQRDPDDADCLTFRDALPEILHGDAPAERVLWMRAHRESCAACNENYREALLVTARIARQTRRQRETREREERRSANRDAALAGARGQARGRRGLRLRLLLMPAVVVMLLAGVSHFSRSHRMAGFHAIVGEARADGVHMDAGAEPRRLGRGAWCGTESLARARLDLRTGEVELGPSTDVMLVEPRSSLVRLQRGELRVRGTCGVATELGALDVQDGEVRVVATHGGVRVDCQAGSAHWVDSRGERTLSAGDELVRGAAVGAALSRRR